MPPECASAGEVVTSMPPGRKPHPRRLDRRDPREGRARGEEPARARGARRRARGARPGVRARHDRRRARRRARSRACIVVGDDPSLAGDAEFVPEPAGEGAERGLLPRSATASRTRPRRRAGRGRGAARRPARPCAPRSSTRRSRRPRGIRSPSCATPTAPAPRSRPRRRGRARSSRASAPTPPRGTPPPGSSSSRHPTCPASRATSTRSTALETVLHHGVGDHTAEAVARLADRKGTP